MRIKKLRIHNYRSIRDLEVECPPMVTLIGPNNHGKSNVLSALEFGLSTSAKPIEEDFFLYRDSDDNELWVEMIFHQLTEQEKNDLQHYMLYDNTIHIRKTAQLTAYGIKVFYSALVEQPKEEWLQADKASYYTSQERINNTPLRDFIRKTKITKSDVKNAQLEYINKYRDKIAFKSKFEEISSKNKIILPELYLIPAVRDLTDEIRIKTTTTFGRLLIRAIDETTKSNPDFIKAREQLKAVIDLLNTRSANEIQNNKLSQLERLIESELKSWGEIKVNIRVTPPEIEQIFESGIKVLVDDGTETTADRKGNGLQRSMIFALLRVWAKTVQFDRQEQSILNKQSNSLIFIIEEPELFLHPQAQRKLSILLREIAEADGSQVFISTHSTQFVNLENYKEIAIITKKSSREGSSIRQCTEELFKYSNTEKRRKEFNIAQWINPDRGEMFFARRVVFVEGATEKVILPFLAKKLGVFDPEVSIIDCGSKNNLPLYIEIANKFKLSYIVIHDEDLTSGGTSNDLNKEIVSAAGPERVEMLSPDFEGVSGIPKNQVGKKAKVFAALDYFDSLDSSKIPVRLKDIIFKIYRNE